MIKNYINKNLKNHSNRGMSFEKVINLTNQYYIDKNIAIIHKKPTPIQVVKVDYPTRSKCKITEAFYKTPSTTDYNGVYKGRYIDFEAKQINSNTSFPFQNIHIHQLSHLKQIDYHKGIAFILIHFTNLNETYLIFYSDFNLIYESYVKINKKSISYSTVKAVGYKIDLINNLYLDYLKIINLVIEKINF
ncbi:MAG: Holliday junction resolvase RecU [Anaeroplasmataceae bacterium]